MLAAQISSACGEKLDTKGLALQYSGGRTDSTKELTAREVNQMIKDMQTACGVQPSAEERMRRKAISRAIQLGWVLPGGRCDMEALDAYCLKYNPEHKGLNGLSKMGLVTLLNQLDKVGTHKGQRATVETARAILGY